MGEAERAGSAFGVPVSFPLGAMGSRPGTCLGPGRGVRPDGADPARTPSCYSELVES
jgi:hypothetical protein